MNIQVLLFQFDFMATEMLICSVNDWFWQIWLIMWVQDFENVPMGLLIFSASAFNKGAFS